MNPSPTTPCLPPWGKVAPQGRMRGDLASPPIPGQSPAEGSRPLPTGQTIDGCQRNPPGRACPAPTARRPGNGCPRKPHSVSISPSVGRGAPTPPRPSVAARSRATRRARRPRRPGKPPAAALPRATTRGGVKTPPYGPTRKRLPTQTCGRHICRPYSTYINPIRRAGCPHPAATLRRCPFAGNRIQSHCRRGRRPRRPATFRRR